MHIVDRLRRNAVKQKEFRHLVRGRQLGVPYSSAKRKADIYFLHKYAGLSYAVLGRMFGVSREMVRRIANIQPPRFTICHPKKSCM